jgi:hypothetical protein
MLLKNLPLRIPLKRHPSKKLLKSHLPHLLLKKSLLKSGLSTTRMEVDS